MLTACVREEKMTLMHVEKQKEASRKYMKKIHEKMDFVVYLTMAGRGVPMK